MATTKIMKPKFRQDTILHFYVFIIDNSMNYKSSSQIFFYHLVKRLRKQYAKIYDPFKIMKERETFNHVQCEKHLWCSVEHLQENIKSNHCGSNSHPNRKCETNTRHRLSLKCSSTLHQSK